MTNQRNTDFVALCIKNIRAHRAQGSMIPANNIILMTLNASAPSYYISYERALSIVYRLIHIPADKRPRRTPVQARASDITDRVERLVNERRFTVLSAVSMVTASAAPRFYISPATAIRLVRSFIYHNKFNTHSPCISYR
jgi:hypothetical protein